MDFWSGRNPDNPQQNPSPISDAKIYQKVIVFSITENPPLNPPTITENPPLNPSLNPPQQIPPTIPG